MVDETKGTGKQDDAFKAPGESKEPLNAADEPHILEEHIVQSTKPAPTPIAHVVPIKKEVVPLEAVAPASLSSLDNNIARLLENIKLPSRRASGGTKEPTKQTFDTSLTLDPKNEAQKKAAGEIAIKTARSMSDALSKVEKSNDDVRALHTLKDDLQHVVRDKKISLVRAVALEEDKREHGVATDEEKEIRAEKSKRAHFRVFITITLLVIGVLAIGAVLYVMRERANGGNALTAAQVLFAEQAVPLPIDGMAPADIRRGVALSRNSGALTLGAILQIIPTKGVPKNQTPASFSQFLDSIGAKYPPELPRALGDLFFLGLHTVDENAPLMVVPVTSYERAFAAMLMWEKTMNSDLSPMFSAVSSIARDENGLPKERVFEDMVMSNYDVRALKDDSGVIQLYYSFPTRNILIIAESPYSFTEILSRLRADRRL